MDHTHFARRPLGLQGPIFPQEILDQIMSHVDDRQTLHSCLLASPALLAGARRGIFRKVTMRPWQLGFAQEFLSVSHRASCVRHLTIEGSLNSVSDTPFTVELLSPFNKLESVSIARLVRWESVSTLPIQCSSVQSLTIAECHLPSTLDVVQLICSYPRLTTLCVRETFWDDSDSTTEFLKTARLPPIRELDVWSVKSSLARIWLLPGVHVQLQKLYACAATYTDALLWIDMVERAGHHLIDLTIIDDNLSFWNSDMDLVE
ncbi:hypothetical protein PHLCEN_2v4617 [Hermanssonia centrifuga]|uniref:F-box domain-containing protein n=1 Tax=Hermanssonia centrifuga TaxID=98765 RepID=A0A2R6PMT1_9APHY|nr:hypothetical protein PHLCEN_2v4617 [Hermanssonia centrifuga]